MRQEAPESPPTSPRPNALNQPHQAHQAHLPAQEQVHQPDLSDHGLAAQQQDAQMDLGHDGMAAADHPMQDVEMQEQADANDGLAEAQGEARLQPEVMRNAGSSSSGNSADSNVCLPAKPAKATNPPTVSEFTHKIVRLMQPLFSMLNLINGTAANGDSFMPSTQVHQFSRNVKEAHLGCTELRKGIRSTKRHHKAQRAAAAAAAQDAQAVDQGATRQAHREALPLYQAPAPAPHAAAVLAGPQPAPPQAQPNATARQEAAAQAAPGSEAETEAAAQAAPGPEAEAEAAAALSIRAASAEAAAEAAADRAEPMDAQPGPMQEQAEGGAGVEVEGVQKQRKRPGGQKKQGRGVSAAPGAEGSNDEAAETSAAAASAVAPHEQVSLHAWLHVCLWQCVRVLQVYTDTVLMRS